MKRLVIVILLFFALACNRKKEQKVTAREIPQDSIELISKEWKEDSLGCSKHRDPRKITRLIEQTKLIGKDTAALIQYLGKPNYVEVNKGIKHYAYFLECYGANKISYSNFYCYFSADTLWYCKHSIY